MKKLFPDPSIICQRSFFSLDSVIVTMVCPRIRVDKISANVDVNSSHIMFYSLHLSFTKLAKAKLRFSKFHNLQIPAVDMKIGLFSKIGFVKSPSPPRPWWPRHGQVFFFSPPPPTQFAQITSNWSHHWATMNNENLGVSLCWKTITCNYLLSLYWTQKET